jgi:hypothetical protein
MASSLIGSLRVALSLGTADFEAGANKAAAISRTKAKEIEGAFGSAKAAITGLFAAFTVGLLTEQIKKSLDYAGSLAEVSRTLGVTTKDLQTFRFAATQTGVAQDQLEVGLRRLTVSMGKAELGSKDQAKAFGAIGISLDQLKGKNTGEVFRLMADGLSKVTDRSQRAAIEMTLMGRSGSTLDNLLAPGAKRLNELAEAAQRLGIVLSDSQIQGAEETAHKLEAVKQVLAAQIAGVVADNASAILSLSSALASLTSSIVKFLGSNPALALGIVGALLGGRVGGLPGAVLGGAAGALLGGKIGQSAADSNTDIDFRKQQLRNALAAWHSAGAAGGPAMSVGGIQTGGGAPNTAALKKEVIRQTDLLNAAVAQARAPKVSPPAGVDVPQIFAGKDAKAKRPPKDLNEDVSYQFAQQQRQVDQEILQAKIALSHDTAEQAQLQLQMLDLATQARDAEIEHRVKKAQQDFAEGKITKATLDEVTAQAAILKEKGEQADRLKAQAILDERDSRLIQEQEAIDSHYLEIKQGLLQKQADLAQTQSERRAIELELLEIAYKEKRQALERLLESSKDAVTIANARNDLANLDANHALDKAGVIQQTRGPLEQWAAGMPDTAAKINEALQSIEVQGLDGLGQAITDVITGTKSLKDAFGELAKSIIADLIQMTIKMLIFRAVSSILGSAAASGLGNSPFPW